MPVYYGTAKVLAKPMTRGEYNKYRGWTLPKGENGKDDGYLLENLDTDHGNHPEHTGPIGWVQKEVFEDVYQPLDALNFGHAILAALSGKTQGAKIARGAWVTGDYVQLFDDDNNPDTPPHFTRFAVNGAQLPGWSPDHKDMLATDWYVMPEEEKTHND